MICVCGCCPRAENFPRSYRFSVGDRVVGTGLDLLLMLPGTLAKRASGKARRLPRHAGDFNSGLRGLQYKQLTQDDVDQGSEFPRNKKLESARSSTRNWGSSDVSWSARSTRSLEGEGLPHFCHTSSHIGHQATSSL